MDQRKNKIFVDESSLVFLGDMPLTSSLLLWPDFFHPRWLEGFIYFRGHSSAIVKARVHDYTLTILTLIRNGD